MLDILFVSLWVWRLRVLHATETHAVRRRFYFRIGAAGAFSFAVLPLTVIVGALVVPYARKRTVRRRCGGVEPVAWWLRSVGR